MQVVSDFFSFEQRSTHFRPAGSPTKGFEQDCQNTLSPTFEELEIEKHLRVEITKSQLAIECIFYQITRSKIIKLVTYEEMNVKSDAVHALILEYLQEEKENAHQNGSVAFESWLEAII